ncbi:MAG: hypothetical protein ACK52M_13320, partial [bacterium]|jgi:hypothetical protein
MPASDLSSTAPDGLPFARVPVVYLRSNPEQAYVRSFLCMWWNVLLWSIVAVMFWGVMFSVEW